MSKVHNQLEIQFNVAKSTEVDGIEMGVLENGTPFLTGRGLARLCGIEISTLFEWGDKTPIEGNDLRMDKIATLSNLFKWDEAPIEGDRLRMDKLAKLLADQGYEGDRLFLKVPFKEQLEVKAYPDVVCMAFLAYYAFKAEHYCTETAETNFLWLAHKTLQEFIYFNTGYDPKVQLLNSFQHYHDRLMLNPLPNGYFSVFRETSDITLSWIQAGLNLDSHTIPDISVGIIWNKYWKSNNFDTRYGERIKYPHDYPDYYPQAKANGDISAFIFPLSALGDFRLWIQNEYLPNKFPNYLSKKVKEGAFPASKKEAMLKALTPPLSKQLS